MTRLSGVDFYKSQFDGGITTGTKLAEMADAGVGFMIGKVGQAYFFDSRWDEHRFKLLALDDRVVKGGYWYLARAAPGVTYQTTQDADGYFYPPVKAGWTYSTTTYGPNLPTYPVGHHNFSIDLNRGPVGGDEGDPVLASQPGTVSYKLISDGVIYIEHSGNYRTEYRHMKDILVDEGDTVLRGQRVGSISSVAGSGHSTGSHLHVAHWHRANASASWDRVKVRYKGVPMDASVADSETRPDGWGLTGQNVTGVAGPTYTGKSQADMFLEGLDPVNHDPTGWFCAVDVEGAASNYGLPPHWEEVSEFADEFWRQAPGHPLFLYTSRSYWGTVQGHYGDGGLIDARAYGFKGLWTADYTQISGGIWQANFDTVAETLSFTRTASTPFAGDYAGFVNSRILQYGALHVNGTRLDGNAFNGTLDQLRALIGVSGPPPVVNTSIAGAPVLAALKASGSITAGGIDPISTIAMTGAITLRALSAGGHLTNGPVVTDINPCE